MDARDQRVAASAVSLTCHNEFSRASPPMSRGNGGPNGSVLSSKERDMSNKHPAPADSPVDLQDDLDRNPGIGQSKGLFARTSGEDAELIEGANTVEGDTENDGGNAGGVDPKLG